MNPTHKSSTIPLLFAALLVPALLLSGCSGGFTMPDSNVVTQVPVGAMKGSVYGGHAPLTQAHVYMLQPSTTGYGTQATSIIKSTASNAVLGSDPGLPSNSYYVLTDGSGQFNLTGDYTCTAGVPVYLYAYAGYPDFPQSSGNNTNNTFNVQSVSVSGSGPYTYTFTFTTQSFNFSGQTVYFNQAYGPFSAGSTYTSTNPYTVIGAPAPGQITLQSSTNSSSPLSGLQLTFAIPYNTDAVNLAVLGVCPSTGSLQAGGTIFNGTTSSPLNYIYMNEVSTVAAAYAFAPFSANAALSGTFSYRSGYATYIGTSSTNLVGLDNAALNAGMLFSVNGSGPLTTGFQGEGHIANPTTPTGNGIINQAVIDTVANILADCVDSQSGSVGTSTQCATLFKYATQNGIPTGDPSAGTPPNDTATAAINIALHPSGPPPSDTSTSASAWMSALYALNVSTSPFAPFMTAQPNDFTIGIYYSEASNGGSSGVFNGVAGVAVDKIGEVWFTSQGSAGNGSFFNFSPQGAFINIGTFSEALGAPVIDSQGDLWFQPINVQDSTYYLQATNTSTNPYVYNTTPTAAVAPPAGQFLPETVTYAGDSSGNMYFITPTTNNSTSGYWYLDEWSLPLGSTGVGVGRVANSLFNTNYNATGGAVDTNGGIWLDEYNSGTPANYIMRTLLASGASPNTSLWPVTSSTSGCTNLSEPAGIAVTRSGDAIVASELSNSVMYIGQSSAACTELTNSSLHTGINTPVAVAVDGRDYAYVLNRGSTTATQVDGSVTVLNTQSGNASGTYGINLRMSPQYQPSGTLTSMLYYPTAMALDPSGNIWVVNNPGANFSRQNAVVEIIGAAAPTTTPLARAVCSGTTGCIGYAP
jgi:hypothetical protein